MHLNVNKFKAKLLLFNIQSVLNKWLDISNDTDNLDTKYSCKKTWFAHSIDLVVFTYKPYNKFTANRQDKLGGGVKCLIDPCFQVIEIAKPVTLPASCE